MTEDFSSVDWKENKKLIEYQLSELEKKYQKVEDRMIELHTTMEKQFKKVEIDINTLIVKLTMYGIIGGVITSTIVTFVMGIISSHPALKGISGK